MANCIFCAIIQGQIPSAKVYEDNDVLAFMDINPVSPGHLLVIPKAHHECVTDMPDDLMAKVGAVLPRLCRAVVKATGAEGFNIFQSNGLCAGQEVMHVHFHIVARRPGDGIGLRPAPGTYAEGELATYRDRIAAALDEG